MECVYMCNDKTIIGNNPFIQIMHFDASFLNTADLPLFSSSGGDINAPTPCLLTIKPPKHLGMLNW